ncbi:hypothetical protein FGG78_19850 [Thioclava sp. BHET1]|nr:hypothetical protein FGG78_19850 [Thioclava sp. BHET1]
MTYLANVPRYGAHQVPGAPQDLPEAGRCAASFRDLTVMRRRRWSERVDLLATLTIGGAVALLLAVIALVFADHAAAAQLVGVMQ